MKKTTQSKFSKQLTKYTALTAAIVGVAEANGQINYTDVDPDFMGGVGSEFLLDLNNDGTNEFAIRQDVFNGLYLYPLGSDNDFIGSGYYSLAYPSALSSGFPIGPSASNWVDNVSSYGYAKFTMNRIGIASGSYGYSSNCYAGNWCNASDKFLGLRFQISGNVHHGWVRLDADSFGNWSVKDYAYNTVPNAVINSGELPPQQTTYTFNNGVWSPGDPSGVATINDDIVIDSGDFTLNSVLNCNRLTIEPGASISLVNGANLITNLPPLLKSNSTSFSSIIRELSGTDFQVTSENNLPIISYERFVNSNLNGNDLITSPVGGLGWATFLGTGTNAIDLLDDGNDPTTYAFAPFDKSTGDYVNFTESGNPSLSGRGYRVATDNGTTLNFRGFLSIFVSTQVLNSGPSFEKWNLQGNVFASYISVQEFLSNPNNNLLFEDGNVAVYGYDGNASDGWTVLNLANTTPETLIAPGQGFFIAVKEDGFIQFTPEMVRTGNSDDFIPGRSAELQFLKLNLSSQTESMKTEFYFNPVASLGLDRGYDAEAFKMSSSNLKLYSHLVEANEGVNMGIQSLNSSDISDISIPLGVNANQGEQITFSIEEMNLPGSVNVYLDDLVAGTSTLLNDSDHILTPNLNLSGTGRFYLRFSDEALSTIDKTLENLNIYALQTSKELVVSGQLSNTSTLILHDIKGRIVLQKELNDPKIENRIDVSNLTSGIYLVTVSNENQSIRKKVILK